MSSLELLTSGSFEEELVVSKLNNKECLKSAHIHPFSLLVALKQYKTGHGNKGKLSWTANTTVTKALEGIFPLRLIILLVHARELTRVSQ
jgi:60 kDa SS-A/Ro ribonucleoprotein